MTRFPIKDRLMPLVRRKRATRFWSGLALCWLLGSLVAAGLLVLGALSGWLPNLVLPVLVASSIAAAAVYWVRRRRVPLDWLGCARAVERRYPELDGRLLTAIEQKPDERGQFSYLQCRLLDEVLAHDRMFDWAALFPGSRVGLIKLIHAFTFAAFLVTCFKLGSLQYEKLGETNSASGAVITPGDTTVERGSRLVVMARFNAQVPASVDLLVRQPGRELQRIPLVRGLEDPIFGGSLPEVTGDLDYSVEYGGRSSRNFKVTVFDYPTMERADADLTYPDYTSQEPKHIEDTRHISAVTGTLLDLTIQLNKPVAGARLVPRDDAAAPIVLVSTPEQAAARLTEFVLANSGRYALELVDSEGRTNKQSVQFSFNVLTNRIPELKIASPRGDIRPSALEEVRFAGTIFDDFGVLTYGLAYLVGGQDMKTIELGGPVAGKERASFEHVISFEDLGLEPGDLVSWFFWSEDVGPDGQIRRILGDLYFAEVRPFDEIFRQGQSQFGEGGAQQQSGGQQGGGGGQTARLTELQQQIIHATWRLQREREAAGARVDTDSPQSSIELQESHDPVGQYHAQRLSPFLRAMLNDPILLADPPARLFAQGVSSGPRGAAIEPQPSSADLSTQDIDVVTEAQREALAQAEEAMRNQEDPLQIANWGEAIKQMETALQQLIKAADSPAALQEALAAQQAAYQRLLKLQEREFSVSRNRNQSGTSSQNGAQRQRQLDQLDLTSEENRYETERLARAPQSAEQQEQLQVMSRLAELARRQQDINERLQEMQTALEAAQTEQERDQLRKELKRLQQEQRQMLADVDELRQRMETGENQSQFSEQQEQLEQTRESLQRASEATEKGALSQALAAGTRAEREMQEMREELRNQSASAFAEDMREMRSEARDLTRRQNAIQDQIESLSQRNSRSLSDSAEVSDLRELLAEQQMRLTNLVEQATEVSQLAEQAEPLMSSELYETLREFSQDDLGAVKQVQEELLANGMFPLYQRLKEIAEEGGAKTLKMTSEVVGENMTELARRAGERAQQDMDDLARGIERAAELILGDDTEALRLAESELEELSNQLRQEAAREGASQTNSIGSSPREQAQRSANQTGQPSGNPDGTAQSDVDTPGESARGGQRPGGAQGEPSRQTAQPGETGQPQSGADRNQNGGEGGEGDEPQEARANGEGGNGGNPQPGQGGDIDFNQFFQGGNGGGGSQLTGPITGDDFGPWSERLRAVEELVEAPDLRNELIRAREQARQWRRNFTRDQEKPDWAQVRLQVLEPLLEVRKDISEELARRQSRESLVPIDRDPVPERYSELVRRYYEELGRDRE